MSNDNVTTTTTQVGGFKFGNQAYDALKFIALIALPALAVLYFALSSLWEWQYTVQILGTITALDTFLGVLLGISTSSYKKAVVSDGAVTDGTLVIDTENPMKDTYSLEVETPFEELQNKKTITLKVAGPQ